MKPETQQWMADIDAYCSEQTGMGEGWCVFKYERIGKSENATNLTHMRFTGNYKVTADLFGGSEWVHDPTTERVVVVSCVDFDAWVKRREGGDK